MTSVIEALGLLAFILLTIGIPLILVAVGLVRIVRLLATKKRPRGISDWWLVAIGLTLFGVSFFLFWPRFH